MKTNTNKKWSPLDVRDLKETVKKYPHNLSYAFFIVSEKTGHTISGVSQKYYKMAKAKDKNGKLKNFFFKLWSSFTKNVNTKNVSRDKLC